MRFFFSKCRLELKYFQSHPTSCCTNPGMLWNFCPDSPEYAPNHLIGIKMTYDTNMRFKTGIAALLHYPDIHEGPDCLLQENCGLTPDKISVIRKYRAPSLDILAGFVDSSLNTSQESLTSQYMTVRCCPPIIAANILAMVIPPRQLP